VGSDRSAEEAGAVDEADKGDKNTKEVSCLFKTSAGADVYVCRMTRAFDQSAAVFVRGLENLRVVLEKGRAHAAAHGIEEKTMVEARLADDMHDLAAQVHWAGEGAVIAIDRLLGVTAQPNPTAATTFADLDARLQTIVTTLSAVSPEALEAGFEASITVPLRGGGKTFRGDLFLTEFAIPSFYFHLTTAYAILRQRGVPLQKGDFLGM
jgi:uncharacterized protein